VSVKIWLPVGAGEERTPVPAASVMDVAVEATGPASVVCALLAAVNVATARYTHPYPLNA
jgi:hypothetical protein